MTTDAHRNPHPTGRPDPIGAFVEIPYALQSVWLRPGYTWEELVAANGLPAAVRQGLSERSRQWCERVVRVWPDVATYRAERQVPSCATGRAWLGPSTTGPLPVIFLTGIMNPPITTSRSGRWRW